jgi:hypothetical protein
MADIVTITTAGVTPKRVRIAVGGHVIFTNNDVRAHDMSSDPPHVHTDCPAIARAGFLSPGQSRATDPFPTPRTCGYHDHMNENDTSFHGVIVIE